jgi:predicted TIM-barrel fold metal-dependent hydrolase
MSDRKDVKSTGAGKVSRRNMLKLTTGAAGFTFLQRRAGALPIPASRFVDSIALERIADRDTDLHPPLLVDLQTHVWWRAGGIQKMTPRGESFLKTLAGARASVIGRPVPVADMGRVMFFDDIFLQSKTDIAFLNSFGMRAAFDGVDLFPPREAAMIRSMAPARIKVLGTVDPPDGQSAVESLTYQCETLKIDGLKLYPPGPDARGWKMDDEKNTYPLYQVLRKHGVKNICVHKGLPGLFLEEYCHTADMARAAADFPDLNFIAFHSAFPFEAELAEQAKKAKVKNIYAELGTLAATMARDPNRYAQLMGTLLGGLGADHLLWGTDTPVIGPPHWQIEAFQAFSIPDEMIERNKYPQLTADAKRKILGENVARLFNIDIPAARRAVETDLLYKLREDGNPLPVTVNIDKLRKQ